MNKEYYKKRLVDLRAEVAKEREAKKRDNTHYTNLIKNSSSPSTKASYRKSKIDRAAAHDRRIEYLKKEIERMRDALKRCK
ncbi:hypothetical protein [Millionella massiliensis]|uniref:hypothetical protein n=1 Tax=Millionella massiliensis TaxID=1871023 RepID=UPI0023A7C1A1|nr:hypothetical protein [Millionella massiliensis]